MNTDKPEMAGAGQQNVVKTPALAAVSSAEIFRNIKRVTGPDD